MRVREPAGLSHRSGAKLRPVVSSPLLCQAPVPPLVTVTAAQRGGANRSVFTLCVAILVQNLALAHVPSATGSLLLSLESPSGVLFSVLLAGEMLSARLVAGFALIFCSIVVSEAKLAFLARPLREARS
ncbi:EamA family transporter [Collinsella intestinalis]|uniref:EamA family transporter n=1 Tax=Collinsella intestinalis TaxID=147207 RepID=UPI00315C9B1A